MPPFRIALFGAQGQLGKALIDAASVRGVELAPFGRATDITRRDAVIAAASKLPFDTIINAAAYTAVDRAETESDIAYRVNRDGAHNVALATQATGAALIHLSTDYVFDGAKPTAYEEVDPISPLGVYGASKAAGETAAASSCARTVVVRTSWLYGGDGANFVNTVIGLAAKPDPIRMVDDRRGSPTPVDALAAALLDMAHAAAGQAMPYGVYHLASPDACSRFALTEAIFACLAKAGRKTPPLLAVKTQREIARRPQNSALCCDKTERALDIRLPPWRQSLEQVLSRKLPA